MTVPEPGPWSPGDQPTVGRSIFIARLAGILVWALGFGSLIALEQTGALLWHAATFATFLAVLPITLALSAVVRRRQRDLDLAWASHLHDLAIRDELTGLFNRRYFNAELDRLAAECEQTGMPLSLAFIDLNDFKLINDAHGHAAGDAALQGVARCLLDLIGDRGLVARTGGDEFGILLPGMSESEAHALFGPVCRTMPVLVGGRMFGIDGTVGIAALDADAGVSQLLRRADDHLYEKKRAQNRSPRAA